MSTGRVEDHEEVCCFHSSPGTTRRLSYTIIGIEQCFVCPKGRFQCLVQTSLNFMHFYIQSLKFQTIFLIKNILKVMWFGIRTSVVSYICTYVLKVLFS